MHTPPGISVWDKNDRSAKALRSFLQSKARGQTLSTGFGAGNGTRTCDLLITNQLLYQLSYTSV